MGEPEPGVSRPIIRGLEGPLVKILQNGMSVSDASSLSDCYAGIWPTGRELVLYATLWRGADNMVRDREKSGERGVRLSTSLLKDVAPLPGHSLVVGVRTRF
jgi:hypothetical protein